MILKDYDDLIQMAYINKINLFINKINKFSNINNNEIKINYKVQSRYIKVTAKIINNSITDFNYLINDRAVYKSTLNWDRKNNEYVLFFIDTYNLNEKIYKSSSLRPNCFKSFSINYILKEKKLPFNSHYQLLMLEYIINKIKNNKFKKRKNV